MLPEPEALRAAAGSLLETGHLLIEQAVKFHLGVPCSALTRRSFDDTQACDVPDLTQVARGKGWAVGTALGSSDIRNAFAHRDYKIVDDRVLLSPARRVAHASADLSASLEEIQDNILELVEICAAMDLCLLAVLEHAGLSDRYVAPQTEFLLRSVLYAIGWRDVSIGMDGDAVTVSASAADQVGWSSIAMAAQGFTNRHSKLILHLRRPTTNEHAVVIVPLDLFAAWESHASEFGKDVAFLRLVAKTIRNGEPLMGAGQVRQHIAYRCCQAASSVERPFASINAELKAWRLAARDLGDSHLDRLIGRAIRWRATRETGVPVDPAEMNDLLGAAGEPAGSMRSAVFSRG